MKRIMLRKPFDIDIEDTEAPCPTAGRSSYEPEQPVLRRGLRWRCTEAPIMTWPAALEASVGVPDVHGLRGRGRGSQDWARCL